MRRRLLLFILLLAVFFSTGWPTATAWAGFTWCKSDPVVLTNGRVIHVIAAIPRDWRDQLVRGRQAIPLSLIAPQGSRMVVDSAGLIPLHVDFSASGWPDQITVTVNAPKTTTPYPGSLMIVTDGRVLAVAVFESGKTVTVKASWP